MSADLGANVRLSLIALEQCAVRRGEGLPQAGSVQAAYAVTGRYYAADRAVAFVVKGTLVLRDPSQELVAEIDASIACVYDCLTEEAPTEVELEAFGTSDALRHAEPYLREFFSSMIGRLGLPQFFLPLGATQESAGAGSSASADGARRERASTTARRT